MSIVNTNSLPNNFTPTDPTLKNLLDLHKEDVFKNLNCHHIGTIKIFNPLLQTAIATINYQKTYYKLNTITNQYDPFYENYPILMDCPVICLGGGLSSLTFPILPGDECLVLFNDRDIDNWFSGSSSNPVSTPRMHSLSDGIIIVGIRSLPNVLKTYSSTHAVLSNSAGLTGVGVGLTTIKIYNALFTLNDLIQQLITEIQAVCTATTSLVTAVGNITVTSPINVPSTPFTGSTTSGGPNNSAAIAAVAAPLAAANTALGVTATEFSQLLE